MAQVITFHKAICCGERKGGKYHMLFSACYVLDICYYNKTKHDLKCTKNKI